MFSDPILPGADWPPEPGGGIVNGTGFCCGNRGGGCNIVADEDEAGESIDREDVDEDCDGLFLDDIGGGVGWANGAGSDRR